MPLEDEFCDIVKKARCGLGKSVEQLSQALHVSIKELEGIEKGVLLPTSSQVEAFAKELSLKPSALQAIALDRWEPNPLPAWVETLVMTVFGDIGGYEVKGYVLVDSTTRDSICIDTAYHAKGMIKTIKKQAGRVVGVCLTHGHPDHAGGLDEILEEWPVPVYLGAGDVSLLPWTPPKEHLAALRDGQKIIVGNLTVTCMETPGHTPGGFCFQVKRKEHDLCFVGDTLFAGSIGRSNPFSLYPRHLQSVRERVLRLSSETVLLPGHGPGTTVREELVYNPFGI